MKGGVSKKGNESQFDINKMSQHWDTALGGFKKRNKNVLDYGW